MHALDNDYLTVKEAAALLRVAPGTVRRWIRAGEVPAYLLGPRRIALRRADVAGLITPIRPEIAPGGPMASEAPAAILTLTPEQVRRGQEVMARLKIQREEIRAERGGQPFSSSWEILNELRDERTRELG